MKKILIRNYWLMIIAWTLILSDYIVLGCLLSLFATAFVIASKRISNYWRLIALALSVFIVSALILQNGNIPYYYAGIIPFIFFVLINAMATNEFIYIFKAKSLYSVLFISLLGFLVFLAVLIIVPNDAYSLIGKVNLFTIICFIFLPYIIPLLACILTKSIKNNKVKIKKRSYMR